MTRRVGQTKKASVRRADLQAEVSHPEVSAGSDCVPAPGLQTLRECDQKSLHKAMAKYVSFQTKCSLQEHH